MRTTMAAAATHARRTWLSTSAVPSISCPTTRPMATITAMFASSATHWPATHAAMYLKACGTMAVKRLLNMVPPCCAIAHRAVCAFRRLRRMRENLRHHYACIVACACFMNREKP